MYTGMLPTWSRIGMCRMDLPLKVTNSRITDHAGRNANIKMDTGKTRYVSFLLHGFLLCVAPGNAGLYQDFT